MAEEFRVLRMFRLHQVAMYIMKRNKINVEKNLLSRILRVLHNFCFSEESDLTYGKGKLKPVTEKDREVIERSKRKEITVKKIQRWTES